MSDPWASIRNKMRMTRSWKADPETKKQMMADIQDAARLLRDADALWEFAHKIYGVEDAPDWPAVIEHYFAALPEHLKEKA